MLPALFSIAKKKKKGKRERELFYKIAAILEVTKRDICYPFLEKNV